MRQHIPNKETEKKKKVKGPMPWNKTEQIYVFLNQHFMGIILHTKFSFND